MEITNSSVLELRHRIVAAWRQLLAGYAALEITCHPAWSVDGELRDCQDSDNQLRTASHQTLRPCYRIGSVVRADEPSDTHLRYPALLEVVLPAAPASTALHLGHEAIRIAWEICTGKPAPHLVRFRAGQSRRAVNYQDELLCVIFDRPGPRREDFQFYARGIELAHGYQDPRRNGDGVHLPASILAAPSADVGVGLERVIQAATGWQNIRDLSLDGY